MANTPQAKKRIRRNTNRTASRRTVGVSSAWASTGRWDERSYHATWAMPPAACALEIPGSRQAVADAPTATVHPPPSDRSSPAKTRASRVSSAGSSLRSSSNRRTDSVAISAVSVGVTSRPVS